MLKRGVFVIVLVLLISIVYAQSSLKGDFNNDGKVDFDDLFLFADNFQKEVNKDNEKFDLDKNKKIDVEDFFIFAESFGKKIEETKKFDVGENCKEVFPGFNGNPNERVNLVFMSFNYENIDKFLEKVKPLVNPNDEKNSFFSFEPVNSNKNKFNLWYVDKAEQTTYKPTYVNPYPSGWEDFNEKWKRIASECKIPGNVKVIVNMMNSPFRANVFEGYSTLKQIKTGGLIKTVGLTGAMNLPNDLDDGGATIFHEFMHAFGGHADEYAGYVAVNDDIGALNCDIATTQVACPKWCKGSPIDVDVYKKVDCSKFDFISCIDELYKGRPCSPLDGNGKVGKGGSCVNLIDFCTSIRDKTLCTDTKNNFYLDPLCGWVENGIHPYYKSQCIPGINRVNIGTQCVKGTGCYNGCALRGVFRSEKQGTLQLQQTGLPTGIYNEKVLCDRIKQETGSVGGKCNELFELFK